MADSYVFNGSTQYLQRSVSPLSGYPATICAWNKSDQTKGGYIATVGDASASVEGCGIFDGTHNVGTENYRAIVFNGGANTQDLVDDPDTTWTHVAGRFTTTTCECFADGVSDGSTPHSRAFTNVDATVIGAVLSGGSAGAWLDGAVADIAMYDRLLNDQEIIDLAGGKNPQDIEGLVFYLDGSAGFVDVIGGLDMSADNGGNDPTRDPDYPTISPPATDPGGDEPAFQGRLSFQGANFQGKEIQR